MRRLALLLPIVFALHACATEDGALCGDGLEPVVVTGLNGTLDGAPAVEVLLRVPDTCETLDRTWMFWEDSTETITFGEEPTGVLMRGEVDAGDSDRRIFFRDVNVGVRLDYPGDVESPTLDFVWFANGMDLMAAPCDGTSGALLCGADVMEDR